GVRLRGLRVAVGPELGPAAEEARSARATDAVDAAGACTGDHLPLAGERRAGDAPAVARVADPLRVRDPGAVEEHLAEVDLAAEVAKWPDRHARHAQVDEEVGDAAPLGHAGV